MNAHTPAALLAALLLAAPTAAASATAAPAAPTGTTLRLTVTGPTPLTIAPPPDGATASAPASRTVTLHCDPPRGDHPRAGAACADLDASQGRVERDTDTACILLYDPVDVRAEGVWRGRPVSFERRYGNTCELNARTGAVFAF
ncbi:SSI family serine proteinase inhibitor [Streptomyces sp. CC208A]|uniref:SSI family serine proteinase inhibitor n=1 Tax=Streptomyces sp. CC208A TaxID=3044573 RepID=UPI0024A84A83|nr:SSI family serine proteinase inhibitor [Streptomyces sp. CC208A]